MSTTNDTSNTPNDATNDDVSAAPTKAEQLAEAKTKKELVVIAEALGLETKGLNKTELTEAICEKEDDGPRTMSQTLQAYRAGYTVTLAYSGRKSLNNADAVALFLAGKDPVMVMAAAERILGLDAGFLTAKYANLNPGQQRMNSGNRIRAALKRGDITQESLVA